MGNRLYARWRVVVGTVVLASLITGVVSAHANLKSSDPAFDAVLTKAPTQVVIVFTQETSPPKSDGSVVDAGGATVSTGFVVDPNDRTRMTITLKPNLPNGKYTAKFHTLTESDGGVVDDTIPFTIQVPAAAAATPEARPAGANPPAGTSAASIASSPSSGNTSNTTSRWLLVVFVVCVTGTVVAAAVAFQTRPRAS